jgi:hypothetical protein
MPVLDFELARSINEAIVWLLKRYEPDAGPWPADGSAREFADALRRRDPREVLYLPDLAAAPRWPDEIFRDDDPNHERVFVRVGTTRDQVDYAAAVFNGSLVHWEHLRATIAGEVTFDPMDPDQHWSMKLEPAETLLREKGLTLIPPAVMRLRFGTWPLSGLLDPRADRLREAGAELERVADSLMQTKGIRSRAQAYQTVMKILRMGYDPATLAAALEGRQPASLVELFWWLEERGAPFQWTRGAD